MPTMMSPLPPARQTVAPGTVRRHRWFTPFVGFLAAAALFQILTLRQPPLAVSFTLVAALVALLWWPPSIKRRSPDVGGVP